MSSRLMDGSQLQLNIRFRDFFLWSLLTRGISHASTAYATAIPSRVSVFKGRGKSHVCVPLRLVNCLFLVKGGQTPRTYPLGHNPSLSAAVGQNPPKSEVQNPLGHNIPPLLSSIGLIDWLIWWLSTIERFLVGLFHYSFIVLEHSIDVFKDFKERVLVFVNIYRRRL